VVHKKSAWSVGDNIVLNICRKKEELFLEDSSRKEKKTGNLRPQMGEREKDREEEGKRSQLQAEGVDYV